MKREDVGPVLVVSDHTSRRLVGIVTDRDLAVKVVAEGRDGNSTRLDEVMSTQPVTCNEDDDVSVAIRLMSEHQVRRIPVVDRNNSLMGIVSQADVARYADEEQVGELVEDISQPYGESLVSRGAAYAERSARAGASSLLACSVGFGLGIGLMYLLDPTGGRARRATLKNRTLDAIESAKTRFSGQGQGQVGSAAEDLPR